MITIRLWRSLGLKGRRRSSYYIQFIIVFIICAFLFDKIVIEERYFHRKNIVVQNDLLDYNEDGLRTGWPFEINKHYDVRDLRTYTPKPRILAKFDLPGERGDEQVIIESSKKLILLNQLKLKF